MISTPKIKYIIWDWNGTLIDDAWLFVDLMNDELNSRNLPNITINDYQKYFTFPVKKYYEKLGRLGFDLADTFAGHTKLLTHLFERVIGVHTDTKTHAKHPLFARRQRRQHAGGGFFQVFLNR